MTELVLSAWWIIVLWICSLVKIHLLFVNFLVYYTSIKLIEKILKINKTKKGGNIMLVDSYLRYFQNFTYLPRVFFVQNRANKYQIKWTENKTTDIKNIVYCNPGQLFSEGRAPDLTPNYCGFDSWSREYIWVASSQTWGTCGRQAIDVFLSLLNQCCSLPFSSLPSTLLKKQWKNILRWRLTITNKE